jgi:[acyl-carrier-protein] S-malonyltransferase
MRPASAKLARALERVAISQPRLPVVSNVTAKYIRSASEIRDLLVRQLTQPVLWEDSMRFFLAQGIRQFVEVGPGKVLSSLLRRIDPAVESYRINTPSDIEEYQAAPEEV